MLHVTLSLNFPVEGSDYGRRLGVGYLAAYVFARRVDFHNFGELLSYELVHREAGSPFPV